MLAENVSRVGLASNMVEAGNVKMLSRSNVIRAGEAPTTRYVRKVVGELLPGEIHSFGRMFRPVDASQSLELRYKANRSK